MSGKGRDYLLFAEDILTAVEKIETYTRNLSYDEFAATSVVIDAVIRNFEVIGEASKNIPKRIKNRYPEILWKEAAGFRDVLIHNYFGIDTTADKLRAMESLWDDLCRRADGISSPMWHHDILTAREQGVLAGEANFCEWETAKIKIRESNS